MKKIGHGHKWEQGQIIQMGPVAIMASGQRAKHIEEQEGQWPRWNRRVQQMSRATAAKCSWLQWPPD